jgi:hypothetical protein
MATKRKQLVVADLRGGINQFDPPTASGTEDRVLTDARNIEFFAGGLCRKRQGCAEPAGLTYSATAGRLASLFRHVKKTTEGDTELWCVTDGGGLGRMTISSQEFVDVAPVDALTSAQAQHAHAASLDGMLFIAAKNAQDRLHVWDGTSYRRVGIEPNAAAPSTSTAAGAVTDTRKYRVTWVKKTGSTIDVRSEPSGETGAIAMAAQKCTVTCPTDPGESETHWELWASSTASSYTTWYKVGDATIATATIEDNNATLADATGLVADDLGTNLVPKSAKYIVADENRLVLAGSWDNEIYASRVWFTPVLGASDIGDAERIPELETTGQKNWLDVARGSGGGITGLAGPVNDSLYVFKASQIHKLIRTNVSSRPYRTMAMSKDVGSISSKAIVLGEDEAGNPAVYFLSRRGPYRISTAGLEYLGADIERTWETVNLDADDMVAHGVYHHRKHQVWWWVSTGTSDRPDTLLVYDTQRGVGSQVGIRGGWSIYDGDVTSAYSSVMYSKDLGVTNASYDLRPYFGQHDADEKLIRCDEDDLYTDLGSGYQSYFRTRSHPLGGLERKVRVLGVAVVAKPQRDVSPCLWIRAESNWGDHFAEYHVSIPPGLTDRTLVNQPEPSGPRPGPGDTDLVALYVFDSADQQVGWQLDALVLEYAPDGER